MGKTKAQVEAEAVAEVMAEEVAMSNALVERVRLEIMLPKLHDGPDRDALAALSTLADYVKELEERLMAYETRKMG